MVYKLYSEIDEREISNSTTNSGINLPNFSIRTESWLAWTIIALVKLLLCVYDVISWPVYFAIQRPDRRAKEARGVRSERVDINTWIRTNPNGFNSPVEVDGSSSRKTYKFMGSTLSEIFANAVLEFSDNICLGYRAVVTCPVLVLNEEGEHVLQDKSFRSDFTWYTYEQIGRRVQDIASGLYHHSVYPNSRALFLASTSLEWFCVSQACIQLATTIVVASEINDESSLKLILKESGVDVIFISCDKIGKLCRVFDGLNLINNEDLLHISKIVITDWQFVVDFNEPVFAQLRKSSGYVVDGILSIGQIEEVGIENPIELCCTKSLRDDIDTATPTNVKTRNSATMSPNSKVDLRGKPSSLPLRRRNICKDTDKIDSTKIYRGERRLLVWPHDCYDQPNGRRSPNSARSSPRLSVNEIPKTGDQVRTEPDDVAMIVYTFGSLGQLKPIMLTHSNLARSNHYLFLDGMVNGNDIHCTTLPLDNVIEFMTEMCIFSQGGSIGYSCNRNTLFYDGKELFKKDLSDLEALSPTFLLAKPYILESLRTSIQNYLSYEMNPLISFLLTNVLCGYKKYWAHRHFKTPILDRLICSKLKKLFGSKINYILCSGATDCSETKNFFAFMVNVPVIELYGPDEAMVSMMSVDDIWDYKRRFRVGNCQGDEQVDDFRGVQLLPPKVNRNIFREDSSRNLLFTSSVLCPTIGTRIRLEDWEDFRSSDRPYPRGRMFIGGDVVCKGYLNRPNSTSFFLDDNFIAWFRTDDIARVFPNGSFEIISGISDMIKMVDGQFISLSQIEHILRNSQFVDNVCAICGDDRRLVIALVVPNLRRLALKSPGEADLKMAIGTEPEPEELIDVEFRREVCNDKLLSEFVGGHLSELMEKAGLKAVSNRFLLVPEIWTPESELVTLAYEPKRNSIQKFYATDIQSVVGLGFPTTKKRLSARSTLARGLPNFGFNGQYSTSAQTRGRSSH